jgi:hypothetical protein
MKGKCANIISVESKEESIISFYLKSSASDRYGETCKHFSINRTTFTLHIYLVKPSNNSLNSELFILNSSPKCSLKFFIFGEPSVIFQRD